MKKLLIPFAGMLLATGLWISCKKNGQEKMRLDGKRAQAMQTCTYETLTGDISANRTLSSTIVYKIDGCVTIKNGITLNIPAGTLLQGMKTPSGGGESFLIVERGGKLNISGTSTNPVIFTSDQPSGSRIKGDWGGLRVNGKAENNNGNSVTFDLGCATYTGGGTDNTDNSGTMQYFQVHFAGAPATVNDQSRAAILLNSVGTGTLFDHVQISESLNDGLYLAGGRVAIKNIVNYNTDRTDFKITYGNRSNIQFISAMRINNAAIHSGQANGILISNQPSSSSISTAGGYRLESLGRTPVCSKAGNDGGRDCNDEQ